MLIIDPDDIATRWIKTTEKNSSLSVLKQSDKEFLRSLENCIQVNSDISTLHILSQLIRSLAESTLENVNQAPVE